MDFILKNQKSSSVTSNFRNNFQGLCFNNLIGFLNLLQYLCK